MATATAVREYRKAQSNLVLLAERDLTKFWNALDTSDAIAVRNALEVYMPELIQAYGQAGASVAADFYDDLRSQAKNRRIYRAVIGEAIPIDQARASTRWALGPMFQKESDTKQTLDNLTLISDRLIKQHSRDTISDNARRDPAQVRYARVPTGAETCDFCLMLASRGAVYADKAAAGELNQYHGKCDCVPTPLWDGDALPEGYDPKDLYARYQNRAQ